MKPTCFAVLAALALLLTACGGQHSEYANAIATSVRQSDFPANQEQAQCLGDAFVDVVGVQTFHQRNITPEDIRQGREDPFQYVAELDLDKSQARNLFEAIDRCVGVNSLISKALAKSQLPGQQQQCVRAALNGELVKKLLVAQFSGTLQGNKQLTRELLAAVGGCISQPG